MSCNKRLISDNFNFMYKFLLNNVINGNNLIFRHKLQLTYRYILFKQKDKLQLLFFKDNKTCL